MKTRLTAASFGLAFIAAIYVLAGPLYTVSDGVRTTHRTLLQVNGYRAIAPVAFPVAIALLPLIFRKQPIRILATVILGGFCFISGFSIGLFYLPSAVMMLLAACVSPSAKFRDALP